MKTIMISVKPRYAEQILNGKKTIEVRKFYIEPPFKVVNYVTKGDKNNIFWQSKLYRYIDDRSHNLYDYPLNGKVAFEYVVNKVELFCTDYRQADKNKLNFILKNACLSLEECINYDNGKCLYGFHISDLKIYDKPKELREFRTPKNCGECSVSDCYYCDSKPITRPPQNFVYVEDVK